MPESRNSTYQKVFQHQVLSTAAPFSEPSDTTAASISEVKQHMATTISTTSLSNGQHYLEGTILHSAQIPLRLQQARSFYGKRVARLIIHHNSERKTRTLSWQVDLAPL
jgi:hypothetical protein